MKPIKFAPHYVERVWGGHKMETHFGRILDSEIRGFPIGESWGISDREEVQSIVEGGDYAGLSINELWREHYNQIFASGTPASLRFPLLLKILDANKDLSIQVHPPQEVASALNGEPKNEFWYIADTEPGAKLYIGLRPGVTEPAFRQAIYEGTVEELIHVIEPEVGDFIYIPSGRLHAIGAGLLIYEIQQNSDTTYRVYDWKRKGLNGQPRDLHIEESLQSIDFTDYEPSLDKAVDDVLCRCPDFNIRRKFFYPDEYVKPLDTNNFAIWILIEGQLQDSDQQVYNKGDFVLMPKNTEALKVLKKCVIIETSV